MLSNVLIIVFFLFSVNAYKILSNTRCLLSKSSLHMALINRQPDIKGTMNTRNVFVDFQPANITTQAKEGQLLSIIH